MPKVDEKIYYAPETLATRKELKAAIKGPLPTLDEIETALWLTRGHLGEAADLLKVERRVLARKISATPSLEKTVRDILAIKIDDAEKKLDELVLEGNVTAVTFTLRTLGKERGYTEKSTIEHELGSTATSAAGLIASLRKGAELPALEVAEDEDIIEIEGTPVEEEAEWDES